MHRIIYFLFLISQIAIASAPDVSRSELKKQYEEFQTTYSKTLDLSKEKSLFTKNFDLHTKMLKKKYALFSQIEKTEITAEGNQMALDIEMLEPLEFLASSRINKDSCSEAELLNEMNSTSDVKTYQKIKQTLKRLCR